MYYGTFEVKITFSKCIRIERGTKIIVTGLVTINNETLIIKMTTDTNWGQ